MARESQIERYLRREVERLGGMCLKWVSPGVTGVPDRIILLPGRIIFAELKAEGGAPSARQRLMLERLRGLGADCRLVEGIDTVTALVNEIKEDNTNEDE